MQNSEAIFRLTQMQKVASKNIVMYAEAGKGEAAQSEADFFNLIDTYLPEPANGKDVDTAIHELGLSYEMKSMGPLMKHLKSKFEIVDGNLVKSILMRTRLNENCKLSHKST